MRVPRFDYGYGGGQEGMHPRPDGQYVRFEDIEPMLREFAKENAVSYRCAECGAWHLRQQETVTPVHD